jgi:hypothetical protein
MIILYKYELKYELKCRDKAMKSILDNTSLSLKTVKSLEVVDFLISVEYAFKDISDNNMISIEKVHEFVQSEDLVGVWQIEDIYGRIILPLSPPETTRLITDYLMMRIQNNGSLDLDDKLFLGLENDEDEW